MGLLQVGFEIARLPKGTNITTPMFFDKMANTMADTADCNAGVRVGIGNAIFQLSGSVMSDPFALTCILTGIYVIAATRVANTVVRGPLSANPGLARLMLAIAGIAMGTAFAATLLPNINK